MSLINYVEPAASNGMAFAGIGSLAISLVVAYILYRVYKKFIDWFDVKVNMDLKYAILEESYLDQNAKKRGIDLDKELLKKNIIRGNKKKTLREKIEEELYNDMFKEDNKK